MLFIKKISILFVLFSSLLVLHSCDNEPDDEIIPETPVVENGIVFTSLGTLTVNINHLYDNVPLQLAPTSYVTKANDTIRFTEIRYYITNIELTTKAGTKVNLGNANLIDFLPPNASSFSVDSIPVGNYTAVSYLIGVDSIRNTGTVNEGDLDPNYNMFWPWPTSYIFMRCKGRYTAAELSFSFDIGGTSNVMFASHNLTPFKKVGAAAALNLNMNMGTFFNTPIQYDLKTDPIDIHTLGSPGIAKLRPNIMAAFSLKDIQ